jgi:hypothetical protein
MIREVKVYSWVKLCVCLHTVTEHRCLVGAKKCVGRKKTFFSTRSEQWRTRLLFKTDNEACRL